MSKLKPIAIIVLLGAILALLLLSALNVLPRQELVRVCPVDAISMQAGNAVIDPIKCIGCSRCVTGVPGIVMPAVAVTSTVEPKTVAVEASLPSTAVATASAAAEPAKPLAKAVKETKPAPPPVVAAKYSVNKETCIGCGLCTIYCPTGAISLVDGKAVIDPKKCINCGICKNGNGADYQGCPVDAIAGP